MRVSSNCLLSKEPTVGLIARGGKRQPPQRAEKLESRRSRWSPAGRPSRNSASGVRLSLSAPRRARIHVAITLLDLMQGD
jgi:hypothetical protein